VALDQGSTSGLTASPRANRRFSQVALTYAASFHPRGILSLSRSSQQQRVLAAGGCLQRGRQGLGLGGRERQGGQDTWASRSAASLVRLAGHEGRGGQRLIGLHPIQWVREAAILAPVFDKRWSSFACNTGRVSDCLGWMDPLHGSRARDTGMNPTADLQVGREPGRCPLPLSLHRETAPFARSRRQPFSGAPGADQGDHLHGAIHGCW